jgi:hypothetical protein
MSINEFGPNTPKVELFIERLKVLSDEEIKTAAAAAWDTARAAAWDTARDAAWAAEAIVVMDLITEEQFTILTEPFAEILTELGIVWEGK